MTLDPRGDFRCRLERVFDAAILDDLERFVAAVVRAELEKLDEPELAGRSKHDEIDLAGVLRDTP